LATAEANLTQLWEARPTLWGWLSTVDHKKIGFRYLTTSLAFLVLGGVEALVMRLQLAHAESTLLTPEAYNQFFTMHGVTMILWYAAPVLAGFANYLVPLLIGARDMAFPRLNAFSYWVFLCSGIFLYASVFVGQAPNGGWFAYVPLTLDDYSPGFNMDFYALALLFLTVSTTVGAINFIATIMRLRAPGMTIARMPLMMYSTLTTSMLAVLAMPGLTAALVFLELDRRWNTAFYDARFGGDPLLWQHLFWFWAHPWVYIVFLPATGMISVLLPAYARRPIVGYTYVAVATVLTGVVGMGVWVHHMFAAGVSHMSMSLFSAASMTISVFTTIQVFAWIATLWHGRPVRSAALAFVVGFMALLVIGGLSGVTTAMIPLDWQLHDTYYVVAHLHYVLIGANVFPVMAAFYHWWPKMTGRMLSERLGYWSFWLMFGGFNVAFFPMHIAGIIGMQRRVFTYRADSGLEPLNMTVTAGAFVLGVGILVTFVNFARSYRRGEPAPANPWNADSLEWAVTSPPPPYGTAHIPTVVSRQPLWDSHEEERDPAGERILDQSRMTLATTWLDAIPAGISKMPEDTVAPLLVTLLLTGVSAALLLKAIIPAGLLLLAALAVTAYWMWPEAEKHPS